MLVAMIGSVLYMLFGFMQAKQKDPSISFDYNYIYATAAMLASVAMLYDDPIGVVTVSSIIQAFLVGFGGNNAVTKISKLVPTPGGK